MKKSDDDWKNEVEKEKSGLSDNPGETPAMPEEASFAFFLSTLAFQTYAALGEVEDPASGRREVNTEQAKYLIDILAVIKEKTRGNLSPEENTLLEQVLYEARLRYVEKKGGPK